MRCPALIRALARVCLALASCCDAAVRGGKLMARGVSTQVRWHAEKAKVMWQRFATTPPCLQSCALNPRLPYTHSSLFSPSGFLGSLGGSGFGVGPLLGAASGTRGLTASSTSGLARTTATFLQRVAWRVDRASPVCLGQGACS